MFIRLLHSKVGGVAVKSESRCVWQCARVLNATCVPQECGFDGSRAGGRRGHQLTSGRRV